MVPEMVLEKSSTRPNRDIDFTSYISYEEELQPKIAVQSILIEAHLFSLPQTGQSEKLSLRAPLKIHISQDGPHVIVTNEELNLVGHGATVEEAHQDFVEYFISDFMVYKRSNPETLDEGAKQLLNKYERLVALA